MDLNGIDLPDIYTVLESGQDNKYIEVQRLPLLVISPSGKLQIKCFKIFLSAFVQEIPVARISCYIHFEKLG